MAEGKKPSELLNEMPKNGNIINNSNKNENEISDSSSATAESAKAGINSSNSSSSTTNSSSASLIDPDIFHHLITAVELNVTIHGRENNFLLEKCVKLVEKIHLSSHFLYEPNIYQGFSRIYRLNRQFQQSLSELEIAQRESTRNISIIFENEEKFQLALKISIELGEMYLEFPTDTNIYAGKLIFSNLLKKIESSLPLDSPWRIQQGNLIEKMTKVYESLKNVKGKNGENSTNSTNNNSSNNSTSSYMASMGGSSSSLRDMWK